MQVFDRTDGRAVRSGFDFADLKQLRLSGLYKLPDGTEVVVGAGSKNRYFLYHPRLWHIQAWIVSLPVFFEVREDGSLITGKGNATDWSIEDLVDTGVTSEKMKMR